MQTAVVRIPNNHFLMFKTFVHKLKGKIRPIDNDTIKEVILAKLIDLPLEKEKIVPEDIIRKDFKKHGINLYR